MVHRVGGVRAVRRRRGQWKMADSERTQGVINIHCLHTTPSVSYDTLGVSYDCQCLFEAQSFKRAKAEQPTELSAIQANKSPRKQI